MTTSDSEGKAILEKLAREFTSEDFRLALAGANGRTAQLAAFSELWTAGATRATAAKQISIANFYTLQRLMPAGSAEAREFESSIASLVLHLTDLYQWFAMREMMLRELLKAVQEAECKRPDDVRH